MRFAINMEHNGWIYTMVLAEGHYDKNLELRDVSVCNSGLVPGKRRVLNGMDLQHLLPPTVPHSCPWKLVFRPG